MNETVGSQWLVRLTRNGPEWVLQGFTVVGLLMYTFFALVVLKQVGVMTESFESEVNGPVRMFARIHVLLSIFLTVVAIVVL